MKERLMLTAVLVAILIGPIAMLGLAYCTNQPHQPAKPPAPVVTVRSI